jgi:WD40 repeat protein
MQHNFAQWNVGDTILDLYKVTNILGAGGFGKVYKVRHQGWNIDLAVKIPQPEVVAKVGGVENFEREAENWVNLGLHPHTVSCYYVRRIDNSPLVFAEYVAGGSLHDWIYSNRLYAEGTETSLKRILDIAIQFAWGLHYAHEQGLIHQDVKPNNVMLTTEGLVKVTDFGLANVQSEIRSFRLPVTTGKQKVLKIIGSPTGTLGYRSPEQANRKTLTRRSDLWSWAVSVFEMFQGGCNSVGSIAAYSLENYLKAESKNKKLPQMPMQLVQLLRRCFQENPEERPHDMLEVANELQEIYQQTIGEIYPRQQPKAGKDYADSLNNRAASLLDLGKTSEALQLWEKALQAQPQHPESTYNRGLVLWRSGMINDDVLVQDIKRIEEYHPEDWYTKYLLSCVHLECDDCLTANEILEHLQEEERQKQEIKAALYLAKERLRNSRQLLSNFELVEVDPDNLDSVDITYTDNNFMVSINPSLKLYEIGTNRILAEFNEQIGRFTSKFTSKDQQFVLTSSHGYGLKLWEKATGDCVRSFQGHGRKINSLYFARVHSVYLSADNSLALSGSDDATLKLWDVATGDCLHTLKGHQLPVICVCLSEDNQFALSGSDDQTLKLWDINTGNCLRTFVGHTSAVYSVCLSKDNQFILSGSYDGIIKLWELNTGRCLRTFEGHKGIVTGVSMATNGDYAISLSTDKTLKLWAINCLLNSYKAPTVISQITESEKVVDITAKFKQELQKAQAALDRCDYITACEHIREARSQKLYTHDKEALYIWSRLYLCLPLKSFRAAYEHTGFVGDRGFISSVCLSADNRFVLSHNGKFRLYAPEISATMKLWEINTGRCLRKFEVHKSAERSNIPGVLHIPQDRSYLTAICLSPDNQLALSASRRLDRSNSEGENVLMLWEVATGKCLQIFEGYTSYINSICLSANNQFALFGSSDQTLKLLEIATGRLMLNFQGHTLSVSSVSLSADNVFALSGSDDKTLKLWEVATGECLQTFAGHTDAIKSVCLSKNGQLALSGSNDKTLQLWEVATGSCLQTFVGHTKGVNSICLSANNQFALSGSEDGTMKLWEVATGNCLHTFETDTNSIVSVCLSTDSQFVLCASEKGLKMWLLDWELENQVTADIY